MRYLVGVLDDPGSRSALRWAIQRALTTGADIVAVTPFAVPMKLTMQGDEPAKSPALLRVRARRMQDDVLERACAPLDPEQTSRVAFESRVVNGHPTHVLIAESAGADLVIVGETGTHAISLAQCWAQRRRLRSAVDCPVVFVRPRTRRRSRWRRASTAWTTTSS